MFSQLSIKTKMVMVMALIVLVGGASVVSSIIELSLAKSGFEKTKQLAKLSTEIALLVHETQKRARNERRFYRF